MKNIWFVAGAALIVCLFAANVYRAATQSIVHDEAATYNWFLAGPASLMFEHYNANHHVLHTFLCKASVTLFGVSELSMRLPSLLGGGFYLGTCLLFSRYLFGDGWLSLLTTAFLTLNPPVLDFLSLARGYGLGLGLWVFSLLHLVQYVAGGRKTVHLYWAAAGTGLSMAVNLVFVFPCVASMASLLLAMKLVRWEAPVEKKKKKARAAPPPSAVMPVVLRYCLPSVVIAWTIISGPIAQSTAGNFYVGAQSLLESGLSLAEPSYGAGARIAAVVAAAAILAGGAFSASKTRAVPSPRRAALLVIGGAVAPLFALLLLVRFALGLPYPEGRTGLYFIPLTGLLAGILVEETSARPVLSIPAAVFLGLSALRFATLFPTGPYPTWDYDASTRDAVAAIAKDHAAHPRPLVRVGATWQLEPSLNFYRQMHRYDWMAPVTRASPAGPYDYYYLWSNDRPIAERAGFRKLFSNERAQTLLVAAPGL